MILSIWGCGDDGPEEGSGGNAGSASGGKGGGSGGSSAKAGSGGKGGSTGGTGQGGDGGSIAGSAGSAGSSGEGSGGEGGTAGAAGEAGNGGGAGEGVGGTAQGGSAGNAGAGGTGGGAGNAGAGGGGPVQCGVDSFAIVGLQGCYECPGYAYPLLASTCAVFQGGRTEDYSPADHRYDPATHELRLRAGDGMPVPQGWHFEATTPEFTLPGQAAACNAASHYSIDGHEFVADLSEWVACEGLLSIVFSNAMPDYGCADEILSSTYFSVTFGGPTNLDIECYSPRLDPPIAFGSLVPLPKPPRYDVSVPAAVVDLATSLVWEQRADGSYPDLNPSDALAYCAALDSAGHNDWRLPTMNELFTLLDLEGPWVGTLIDTAAFPATPAEIFWTSSTSPSGTWWISFDSDSPYEIFSDYAGDPEATFNVRCVRGGAMPAQRFQINADGTVDDALTGLTWERAPDQSELTPVEAQDHCRTLGLAGGGWRVPTLGELMSIVDPTVTPTIDSTVFPASPVIYWSSTRYQDELHLGWYLYFGDGTFFPSADNYVMDDVGGVRCVR